jgi:uncharacterized delta-60 repeat protein
MTLKTLFFVLIVTIFPEAGFSQDGSPDFAFGTNGVVETDLNGGEDFVNDVVQSEAGRIIVVGETLNIDFFTTFNFMVVYLEDGALDNSFGDNGIVLTETTNTDEQEYDLVTTQADEKILAGRRVGSLYSIIRYLPDGTIDLDFSDNGNLVPFLSGGTYTSLKVLSDGKLLISGSMEIDNIMQIVLKRYLTDGSVDSSFGNNGIKAYPIGDESNMVNGGVFVHEDGKIVIGGKITNNGSVSIVILRCLPDGTLDSDFGSNGVATLPVEEENNCTPLLFADGSILSRCFYFDPVADEFVRTMVKLSPDGVFDQNFGIGGYIYDTLFDIIQQNNRIFDLTGYVDWEGGLSVEVYRYYSNGSSDPSFQFQRNYSEMNNAMLNIQNNGKLLVAGSSIWYSGSTDIALHQYNNDPLSLPENQSASLIVSPNPSEGIFTLHHDSVSDNHPFYINDLTGKLIQKGKLTNVRTTINLSEAQSGLYFLKAGNSTIRLVKN